MRAPGWAQSGAGRWRDPVRRSALWLCDRSRSGLRGAPIARRADEVGDYLDMRREEELIHGNDAREAIAAIYQDAEIARERSGIAGDGDELRNLGSGKLLGLS